MSNDDPRAVSTHVIRLHGPWQCQLRRVERVADSSREDVPEVGSDFKLKVTDARPVWINEDFTGVILLRRPFGRPTGLEPDQSIWLEVEGLPGSAAVRLNEVPLVFPAQPIPSLRQSVRPILKARNCLQIELHWDAGSRLNDSRWGGLLGDVRLSIESDFRTSNR